MHTLRYLLLAASLLWGLLSLTFTHALAATVPAGVQLHAEQSLTRNNGSEPETLDPSLIESVGAANLIRDLFEGLTASNAQGKIVPGVAEKWRQADPVTWTFQLRPQAKWQNGEQVTAHDIVYSFRRLVDPKTGSKYARTFGDFFSNGKEVSTGQKPPQELGVRAIDKTTLEIKTSHPVNFLPELVSNPNLSPLHAKSIEQLGREWTKPGKLMGNGAYALQSWQVNSKIVLEKNPSYWAADQVVINRVIYLPVEDGHVDVKLFESGQNDWVYMLPPGSFDAYLKKYPKDTRNTPMLALRFYALQTQSPFFKDVRVRQALSMVLDRDILAQKVTADGQQPAYGLIVKGVEGADRIDYEWANWPMAKKVETAKALLAQAGVQPGAKFTFSYNTSEYHKKMAIFAASEWKSKLGLTVELEAMEFKVLIKKRHDGQFEMARDGWNADYNDATTFVALVKCDSDQNHSRHCNKEAEQLIQKGLKENDQAKRKAALNEAIRLIMNDYPIIPLLQYSLPRLVKSYVGGYSTDNQMDRFRTQDLYIIKH
jgi:oligopeptide transport system substrate-binding protein